MEVKKNLLSEQIGKKICSTFGIFEGWFTSQKDDWKQEWFLKNGEPIARIDHTFAGQSGIWGSDDYSRSWQNFPDLTREETERRLKLLAFQ